MKFKPILDGIEIILKNIDNFITDVKKIEAFQVVASRAAVIILHD